VRRRSDSPETANIRKKEPGEAAEGHEGDPIFASRCSERVWPTGRKSAEFSGGRTVTVIADYGNVQFS
jgi:hypothetical protein